MIRRYLVPVLFAALLFIPHIQAQTVADLQAQIQVLMNQLQAMQAQQGGSTAAPTTTTTVSNTFDHNLGYGATGDSDVVALQNVLKSEGYFTYASTGNFYDATQIAVKKFQTANGINPTGFVGPQTRALLSTNGTEIIPITDTPTTASPSTFVPTSPTPTPVTRVSFLPTTAALSAPTISGQPGTALSCTNAGSGSVVLNWTKVSADANYQVYRDGSLGYIVPSVKDQSWTDYISGTHTYYVVALDGIHPNSANSNSVTITASSCGSSVTGAPALSSMSPNTAAPNGQVTLYGSNFDWTTFVAMDGAHGTTISPMAVNPTTITFMVPIGTSLGTHTIQVNSKASSYPLSNSLNLTVASGQVSPNITLTANGAQSSLTVPYNSTVTFAWNAISPNGEAVTCKSNFPSGSSANSTYTVSGGVTTSFTFNLTCTGVTTGYASTAGYSVTVLPSSTAGSSSVQPITISSVQYSPASPKAGDWITTTVTVVNSSQTNYNSPFQVIVQGTPLTINSLAAGASQTVTIPNAFTFSYPGTETLNTVIGYPIVGLPGQGNTGNVFTNTLTFTSASGGTTATPTVSISATPNPIAIGQSGSINWSSTNATYCDNSGISNWPSPSSTSGSYPMNPKTGDQGIYTYHVTCYNGVGGPSKSADTGPVIVAAASTVPTMTFTASPATITAAGQVVTFSWSSTNATTCTSPQWIDTSANGSHWLYASSPSYTVTCTGPGGTATKTITVPVVPGGSTGGSTGGTTGTPGSPAPVNVSVSVRVTPTIVDQGGGVNISWSGSGGVGGLMCLRSWQSSLGYTGAYGGTDSIGGLTATQTFSATCKDTLGTTGSGSATVSVRPPAGTSSVYDALSALLTQLSASLKN